MASWQDFLDTADQFFISYSSHTALIPVSLFEIGHTIELYLKAANTKITQDIKNARFYRHDIKAIWDACKTLDPTFMPHFELRDSIFNSEFVHDNGLSLSPDDQIHYFKNQEFYLIAKHLSDIKYLGAPLNSIKKSYYSFAILEKNPYWISFLKELRHYLGWPPPGHRDWIMDCITEKRIPASAARYLSNLYN